MAQPISRSELGHPCRRSPAETSRVALLQPASIAGQVGANPAVGVAGFTLRFGG
jgi:hypothetical protein